MRTRRIPRRSVLLASLAVLLVGLPGPTPAAAVGPLYRVLHHFTTAEGSAPRGEIVQADDGFFYGLLNDAIFRMDEAGNVVIVHRFTGPDGLAPVGLVQGSDGLFYGATSGGGTPVGSYCVFLGGCGTFFRMDASGHVTVLYSFEAGFFDGSRPNGGIVQGPDGWFYGTTFQGGLEFTTIAGLGIAYRISPSGTFQLLHRFTRAEGINPTGGLIRASDGNYYGTTNQYGPSTGGTVFRMTPTGAVAVVHGFAFGDGYQPKARLIQASDGRLYGTTERGGPGGNGLVFRVALNGSGFEVVHGFDQWASDGFRPTTGLIQGPDGSFYGTTDTGGLGVWNQNRSGVVFRMTPGGVVSVVHTFYGPDGRVPLAPLLLADDGMLLGSTFAGGGSNAGVVFEIDPAAPLPVASLSIAPNPLTQGVIGVGTVTLSAPAPTGGTVVELSTNNEGAAQVPRTITVSAGRTAATFRVTSDFPIFGTANLLVFASVQGAGISAPLTVSASGGGGGGGTLALASLTLAPSSVVGGQSVLGTVTLTGPAPAGGVVVTLSSGSPGLAQVPPSVTVPDGATSASFSVSTTDVSKRRAVGITATLAGTSKTAQLTLLA
jgi:uncharacterized repeat protein (TIGR03803 family)